MRPRTLRIVERWLKAAETQWGAAPHRPGRSQGRTLVLSLVCGADSTGEDRPGAQSVTRAKRGTWAMRVATGACDVSFEAREHAPLREHTHLPIND